MDSTPAAPGPRPTVLLVEDDELLADLLVGHLRRRGIEARSCGTVATAIGALDGGLRPALIVLDINLPDAAGWAVTRDPAYQRAGRPPVVVTSAVTMSAAALEREGITGHLPKPFPLDTFMAIVERSILADHAESIPTPGHRS
jgi:DNA-binding NtrC family response regulator